MNEYKTKLYKLPRIYINAPINEGQAIELEQSQAHYFKNVIRKNIGDEIRVFNGNNGEWICTIEQLQKKRCSIIASQQIREQSVISRKIHLFFAPIKKNRMDWAIEKAVELGVTDFHPVITQNTENRKLNIDRIKKQIFEAAEQCERLDIPEFHDIKDLTTSILENNNINILSAIERVEATEIPAIIKGHNKTTDLGYLTGPEGGWTKNEADWLIKQGNISAVSLGENILRAETAILYGISLLKN